MWQNYFLVNEKKYYTGTVFIVKDGLWEVEAVFVCYSTNSGDYVYRIKEKTFFADYENFCRVFISVTDKRDERVRMPVQRALRDRDIENLPLGWIWYIFLMAISTIFHGNIILWIFISYVFFSWRKKKIEQEGTYIEW
jgi:hypothetical protein